MLKNHWNIVIYIGFRLYRIHFIVGIIKFTKIRSRIGFKIIGCSVFSVFKFRSGAIRYISGLLYMSSEWIYSETCLIRSNARPIEMFELRRRSNVSVLLNLPLGPRKNNRIRQEFELQKVKIKKFLSSRLVKLGNIFSKIFRVRQVTQRMSV